jgi:hypothetical protein
MAINLEWNTKSRNKQLDEELNGYLRDYYDSNSVDATDNIYAACLKALSAIVNKKELKLDYRNRIAALYELTGKSSDNRRLLDNRRFFWDVFSWKNLEKSMKEV